MLKNSEKASNIKLIIEYDGTDYSGWQRQKNAISVQQSIEEAINTLTGESVTLYGAGRTDAGVHAKAQVANFYTDSRIPPDRFDYAINSFLSPDIRIVQSQLVPNNFHARFSATGKHYRYSIVMRKQGIAIGRHFHYHIPQALNVEEMEKACKHFEGLHDFVGFMSVGSEAKNTLRYIDKIQLSFKEPFIEINVWGKSFLYNMVRIIAGTLIEVGLGKIQSFEIQDILKSQNRNLAGATAPAHGLCLIEVFYDKNWIDQAKNQGFD